MLAEQEPAVVCGPLLPGRPKHQRGQSAAGVPPTAGHAALRAVAPQAGPLCHIVTSRVSAGSAGMLLTHRAGPWDVGIIRAKDAVDPSSFGPRSSRRFRSSVGRRLASSWSSSHSTSTMTSAPRFSPAGCRRPAASRVGAAPAVGSTARSRRAVMGPDYSPGR